MLRTGLLACLILALCGSHAGAENWRFFGANSQAQLFVDLDSIEREGGKSVVQLRYVFTTEGKATFGHTSGVVPEYSREALELTPTRRQRSLSLRLYAEDGTVLYARQSPKSEESIGLDTPVGALWKFLYPQP